MNVKYVHTLLCACNAVYIYCVCVCVYTYIHERKKRFCEDLKINTLIV